MPLRDPFHPPLDALASWEEIHGAWPATTAFRLNGIIPPEYRSAVRVYITPAEYEVRVYDLRRANRLVAAVELISPGNKDRPQSRKAFVDKCHAMLQQEACVAIVDTVTSLSAKLYAELADRLGANPPRIADCSIYAVSCRTRSGSRGYASKPGSTSSTLVHPCPLFPCG
jgi:hypothetical protein